MSQKSKPFENLTILFIVLIALSAFILREAVTPSANSQAPIVIDGYTGVALTSRHCSYACCQGPGAPLPKNAQCKRLKSLQHSEDTK